MKSENILIILLMVVAGILGSMFIGGVCADKAYAVGSADRAGDYIIVTGKVSSKQELLYVIDVPKQHMVVYHISGVKNTIKIVDNKVSLKRAFSK